MKLAAFAVAVLFAVAPVAYASCGSQHVCADGYTSAPDGTCVPKTVSS